MKQVWLPVIRAGSGSDIFFERLAEGLRDHGIDARLSWFPHWTEACPHVLQLARVPTGTDLIHSNATYAFAFRRPGIPLVATELHYVLDAEYRPFKSRGQHLYHRFVVGAGVARTLRVADAATAISECTADALFRSLGTRVDAVIYPWIDPDLYTPVPDSGSARVFKLFFVGNVSRRKGGDVLPLLADRLGPGFEIRCTGGLRGGEQRHPSITMLGKLTEDALVDEYRRCNAVLIPSRYEGFGYSALEGMACGKPVVGFASCAIAEVLGPLAGDTLCPVDDIEGLAAICRSLHDDPAFAARMGQAGMRRATRFSRKASVEAYLALYGSLGKARHA
jgi:glycosyltransferase involved in cell wall biosynthesis